jgi:hypothetical protein
MCTLLLQKLFSKNSLPPLIQAAQFLFINGSRTSGWMTFGRKGPGNFSGNSSVPVDSIQIV